MHILPCKKGVPVLGQLRHSAAPEAEHVAHEEWHGMQMPLALAYLPTGVQEALQRLGGSRNG